MSLRRRILFSVAAAMLGALVALAAVEIWLRLQGKVTWTVPPGPNVPIIFEADPVLGWRPKAGTYQAPAYDWTGPLRIGIRADHSRDTGAPPDQPPELAFVGCSFTFGWGVSDDETFAARLQQRHPQWRVMDLGVPAYGAYQSLLRLEQILATGVKPPRVLYGYMQGHELRNIAHPVWTFTLEKYSTQGMVAVPYATIDGNGQLVRHPPERYPAWPLRSYLASVALLERQWAILARRDRTEQHMAVSDRVILDMAQLCRAHGIEFGVVFLQAQAEWKDHYARLLGSHDIRLIDCDIPRTPDLVVPHDGHPNARAHAMYADCIERGLTAPPRN